MEIMEEAMGNGRFPPNFNPLLVLWGISKQGNKKARMQRLGDLHPLFASSPLENANQLIKLGCEPLYPTESRPSGNSLGQIASNQS